MAIFYSMNSERISKALQFFASLFVFLLPWQTIWIYREQTFNGTKFQYGTLGWYGIEIILWISIFLFMAWYLKARKEKVSKPSFAWTGDRKFVLSLLLLSLFTSASVFWAVDASIAQQQSLRLLEAALLFFVFFVGSINLKKIAQWFIFGAVVQSLLGIYQFLTQTTFASKWLGLASHPLFETGTSVIQSPEVGRWLRAYGAFPHPNIFGGYLVIALFFTALLFLSEPKKQWLWYSVFSLECVALFFTFSRSAWLSAIVGFVVFFIFLMCSQKYSSGALKKLLWLGGGALAIGLVLSILYVPLVKTRAEVVSIHEVRSIEERKSAPKLAWQLWKESPFLGVGAGNYTQVLKVRFPQASIETYQPVHVVPLLLLAELGLLGMVSFLLAVFFFVKEQKNVFWWGVPLAFFTPLILLDHYLYSLPTGIFLGALFWGLGTRFLSTVYPQK